MTENPDSPPSPQIPSMGADPSAKPEVFKCFKKLGIVGGATLLVQGLSFLSSIFIIRALSLEDFALYTLTYAGLGISQAIGDGAISQSVLTLGGKVHCKTAELANLMVTAKRLRSQTYHNTTQREPLVTVTDTPEFIVIGPTDIAPWLAGTV